MTNAATPRTGPGGTHLAALALAAGLAAACATPGDAVGDAQVAARATAPEARAPRRDARCPAGAPPAAQPATGASSAPRGTGPGATASAPALDGTRDEGSTTPGETAAPPHEGARDSASAPALDGSGWHEALSERGTFRLAWRPARGALPRNEDFALDVAVWRDGRPLRGATLVVRGWMPDHGHGMVRRPLVDEAGEGRYRVDGMLLHMRGRWQIDFDVTDGTTMDTVRFEIEL